MFFIRKVSTDFFIIEKRIQLVKAVRLSTIIDFFEENEFIFFGRGSRKVYFYN